MNERRIFNVSAGDSFVDVLAQNFLAQYQNGQVEELAQVLFLLPNRRACRDLADAFVRANGLVPTILPRMLPVAEVQEDEILLSGQGDLAKSLLPAVGTTERLLFLTRQILRHDKILGVRAITSAQAYELAQNLALFLDAVYQHNLSMDKLDSLLDEAQIYAEHWQRTLDLLSVIRQIWPQELERQNKIDVMQRRQQLLEAELTYWQQTKTTQRIVVAGITAAFPMLKKLMQTVLDLPNGEVWLYGLDRHLSEEDWQQVEVFHPQYELKELLDFLNFSRSAVQDIGEELPREALIAECMRPAPTTFVWRNLHENKQLQKALNGLHFVECDDMRQEANAIALIMRHVLEQPEKTVALVTSNRNLARRVVSELKRWNITADDSAGQPLSLTPIGIYLRLIIEAVGSGLAEADCLALLKHPFTACGMAKAQCRKLARRIELYWRGSRKMADGLNEEEKNLVVTLRQCLKPLTELYAQKSVGLADMLAAHIRVAEALAATDEKSGDKIIWRQDAGQAAADFVNDILLSSTIFEAIAPHDYGQLLTKMLQTQNVRMRYGMHPQVKILGPIEARLTQFDVTIVGEVNEGFWPAQPPVDMLMSRQMRATFGLPDIERSIGLAAADFAHLLNAKDVYLTRAVRLDGTPTAKSRWLLRLETVLTALLGQKEKIYDRYDRQYTAWAKFAERALNVESIKAPAPRPSVEKRPLKLSASNINALLRDPYTIFAKYILQLYPLDELDRPFDRRDYGNIVHKTVELFNHKFGADFPANAKEELLRLGEEQFKTAHVPAEICVFWWPKFEQTVDWLIATEQGYRQNVATIYNEIEGYMRWSLSNGYEVTISGKADRIDITADGGLNIIDYKTGSSGYPQTIKEFQFGYVPQLPTEALIALNGGYEKIKAPVKIKSLRYWLLGKDCKELDDVTAEQAIAITADNIKQRLHEFYEQIPPAPYVYKPDPSNAPKYSDYEHLARYREWGICEDKED